MPINNPTKGNELQFKPTKPMDKGTFTDPGLTFDLVKEKLFLKNPTNPSVDTLYSTSTPADIISQFTLKTTTFASGIYQPTDLTKLKLYNPTNPEGVVNTTYKGLSDAGTIKSQFFPIYFGTGVESVDMELKTISTNLKNNLIAKSKTLSYISNLGNLPKNSSNSSNIIIDKELTPTNSWAAGAGALFGLNLNGTGTSQYSTLALSQLHTNGIPYGELSDFRARKRSVVQQVLDVDLDAIKLPSTSTLLLKHGESSDDRNKYAFYYTAYKNEKAGVYSKFNLRDTYGFGDPGLPGRSIRQDFTRISNIHSEGDSTYAFRGDAITAIAPTVGGYWETELSRDLIKFFFTGPNVTEYSGIDDIMIFRAIITSLTDTYSPTWTPQQMIGRADPNYHYTGYSRELSLDFTVYASDRDEMKPIWQKLNMLAGYTTPSYGEVAPKGPWMRITIGDLFIQQPAIINSLSYTLHDADTTWEINIEEDSWMNQLPHKVNVSMGLNLITDELPRQGGRFYTLNKYKSYDWLSDGIITGTQFTTEFGDDGFLT